VWTLLDHFFCEGLLKLYSTIKFRIGHTKRQDQTKQRNNNNYDSPALTTPILNPEYPRWIR
jgi:hypothetical protein